MLTCTVNEPYYDVITRIYRNRADLICFSCYIWNIEMILRICRDLHELSPHTKIILGGPEVSYESEYILRDYPNVISIVRGEGEEQLLKILDAAAKGVEPPFKSEVGVVADLNTLPFLYDGEESYAHRILYYETSRGCPFNCAYCQSSLSSGVRYLAVERVKKEILVMQKKGAKIIKFLDRTFNCDGKRAKKLFAFLSKLEGDCSYHFEICVDLLDDETMDILSQVPAGRFQFEIGIQSINPNTLSAIGRCNTVQTALAKMAHLKKVGNILLHADLIVGLPFDTKETLYQAIDQIYFICHELQLGFLKLLKGTGMRRMAIEMGYCYQKNPPYEVYSSPWISFDDVLELKRVEWVINKYKNSRCFEKSVAYLIENGFAGPSDFLRTFCKFLEDLSFFDQPRARKSLYEPLYAFAKYHLNKKELKHFAFLLEVEYIRYERSGRAPFLVGENPRLEKTRIHQFLHNLEYIHRFLPLYDKKQAAQILKNVEFHVFELEQKKILLFDFLYDKIEDVTDCF